MKKERGFTAAELAVVGGIIGISVTIATPSVLGTVRTERLNSAARQVSQALQSARYEAMRTNNRAQVQFDTNSKTYRLITWSGATSTTGSATPLPSEVSFADLPDNMTPPGVVSNAASKSGSIPGQQSNGRRKVSFEGSSEIYTATFTSRGLPGKSNGSQVEPGTVNWVCLRNTQGEIVLISVTSEGQVVTWRWNAGTSAWVK